MEADLERAEGMTLGQAWRHALQGKAIARRSWGASRPSVRVTGFRTGEDIDGLGKRPSVADHANLTAEDMDGDDWIVVPDA